MTASWKLKWSLFLILGAAFVAILMWISMSVAGNMAQREPYQKGVASWYGPKFHGRTTASGDEFNMNELTAAHRKLPFGTEVTVKSVRTGKSVKVVINDRGPYIDNRVIDLSKAAAQQIGLTEKGHGPVEIFLE